MSVRAQARCAAAGVRIGLARLGTAFTLAGTLLTWGCRDTPSTIEPEERPPGRPPPVLSSDDEALLASLLSEDPSDFYVARARIWRIGPARWTSEGPEFPGRPEELRGGALERPLEVVVVDELGPRVLLPVDDLDRGSRPPSWSALRLLAVLAPGDLVAGLTRELRPTPWLTLAAGVGLTPREREGEHLRARWSDPACGFSLDLVVDAQDFGPLHEPGPSGRASDPPEPGEGPTRRLAPGTPIYADDKAREPIVVLDAESPSESALLRAAQRVALIGKPTRSGLQQLELRCRGVVITGWVASASVVEVPHRFAVVEAAAPPSSSCAGFGSDGAEPSRVPRATALFNPNGSTLVGVVADEVELAARPLPDGWWRSCVASPWGDLVFDFRLR
ncbi:MAG: hypothetical protein R6X02_27935 [Enhygromyxa sp.]